jgi:hypothetical protein
LEDWEDRQEEEEKEGADAALKTKTPHVNVGNVGKRESTPKLTIKFGFREQSSPESKG